MKFNKILLILVTILLLTGCRAVEEESTVSNQDEVPVEILSVTKGEISKDYKYSSKFLPEEKVIVTPKVQGEVEEVYFDIGEVVKKDDVLFKIDEKDVQKQLDDLVKQLESINLSIEMQKKALESAKGSGFQQQLLQLEQQYKLSEISYNDALVSFKDSSQLYDQGVLSKQQYDQVVSMYKKAEIAYEVAKKSYDLFVDEISVSNIELQDIQYKQLGVKKEQLVLAYNNVKETIENTNVKSPIDGIVSQRGVEKNQMLSAQVAPFTILNINNLLIEIGLSEQLITKVNTGDNVSVIVDSLGDVINGEIVAISPAGDERTMNYLTKIKVNNKNNKFKAGMFVNVIFETDKVTDQVVIPTQCIINYEDKNYVYVVRDQDFVNKVEVKIGINDGKLVEIKDGLSEGDKVIIQGQNLINEDTKIRIVDTE